MSHSVLYRVMNSPMSRCASARFWMTPLRSGSSASPLFVDEVLGELQPHHRFADLRAGPGSAPVPRDHSASSVP